MTTIPATSVWGQTEKRTQSASHALFRTELSHERKHTACSTHRFRSRLNCSFLFEKEVIPKGKKINQGKISFLFPNLIRFKQSRCFLLELREHTSCVNTPGRENKQRAAKLSSDVPSVWALEEISCLNASVLVKAAFRVLHWLVTKPEKAFIFFLPFFKPYRFSSHPRQVLPNRLLLSFELIKVEIQRVWLGLRRLGFKKREDVNGYVNEDTFCPDVTQGLKVKKEKKTALLRFGYLSPHHSWHRDEKVAEIWQEN